MTVQGKCLTLTRLFMGKLVTIIVVVMNRFAYWFLLNAIFLSVCVMFGWAQGEKHACKMYRIVIICMAWK